MRNEERDYRNGDLIEFEDVNSCYYTTIIKARLWEKFTKSELEPSVFAETHRGQISSAYVMG